MESPSIGVLFTVCTYTDADTAVWLICWLNMAKLPINSFPAKHLLNESRMCWSKTHQAWKMQKERSHMQADAYEKLCDHKQ